MSMPGATLQEVYERVIRSRSPEALFGALSGEKAQMIEAVDARYVELARVCHPDRYPEGPEKHMGEEALRQLNVLRDAAHERIADGLYGTPYQGRKGNAIGAVHTRVREYRVTAAFAEDVVSEQFVGER